MKKLIIVLVAALAFAVSVPAVAAPAVAITGSLETKFTSRLSGTTNESFFGLQAGLQGGDKTKAVVILAPWAKPDSAYTTSINSNATAVVDPRLGQTPTGTTPPGEPFNGTLFGTSPQGFPNLIKSMYLQTTGAFWNGGPEVTTTIGSMTVQESPLMADLGNRRGIKVEGLKLGPLGVEAFYAPAGGNARTLNFDEDNQNPQTRIANVDEVRGAKLTAKLGGIDLSANLIQSDGNTPEMAMTAAMMPAQNLALDGYVLRDRAEKQVSRVNGAYAVNPSLTLTASYRSADEAINPMYATRYDANGDGIITTDEWVDSVNNRKFQAFDNRTGATVGADMKVAGIHVNGSYDMATTSADRDPVAKVAADTTLAGFKLNGSVKYVGGDLNDAKLGVERDIQLASLKIRGSYTGEKDVTTGTPVISHEVKAATMLDLIPQLKGVALDARYKTYDDGTATEIEANANYTAPNGITFGLHHLVDATHPNGDESLTTGMKVVF